MTSTEFAARYRLLKNVAARGARSFLAQQVELGRMVMVHYLDSESPQQRAATLARLQALQDPARQKLLEIADVDGSPVAVTLFISSFVDFTTWLDSVSASTPSPVPTPAAVASPASDFTRAFGKIDAPPPAAATPRAATAPPVAAPPVAAPPVAAPPRRVDSPARAGAGEFTRVFGKIDDSTADRPPAFSSSASEKPVTPAQSAPNESEPASTLVMYHSKASKPNENRPLPSAKAESFAPSPSFGAPAPSAASEEASSFTAFFGSQAAAPQSRAELLPSIPAVSNQGAERVMPPVAPVAEVERTPSPAPAPSSPPPGEFTQLFQRLSTLAPSAGGQPALGMGASLDSGRPLESSPRADLAPPAPLPADSMAGLGAAASAPRGPTFAPPPMAAPPSALPNAVMPNAALPGAPAPGVMTPRPPAAPNMALPSPHSLPIGAPTPAGQVAPWGLPSAPAGGGVMAGASTAPSDFTRILGRVVLPGPGPGAALGAATQASAPQATAPAEPSAPLEQKTPAKSMMPLIVALNIVLLATIAIVAYFVLRK